MITHTKIANNIASEVKEEEIKKPIATKEQIDVLKSQVLSIKQNLTIHKNASIIELDYFKTQMTKPEISGFFKIVSQIFGGFVVLFSISSFILLCVFLDKKESPNVLVISYVVDMLVISFVADICCLIIAFVCNRISEFYYNYCKKQEDTIFHLQKKYRRT